MSSTAIEIVTSIQESMTLAKAKKTAYRTMLSRTDMAISDLLHHLENYNFSASEGYCIAKQLQELRRERRHYKVEMEQLDVLTDILHEALVVKAKIALERNLAHQSQRKYTPRVLVDSCKQAV